MTGSQNLAGWYRQLAVKSVVRPLFIVFASTVHVRTELQSRISPAMAVSTTYLACKSLLP